jgi:hypothetical protein
LLTAISQLYTTVVKLRDNCPFLQSVVPELPAYDFENHQRIEKEAAAELQTSFNAEKIVETIHSINVEECMLKSESLSALVLELEEMISSKDTDVNAAIEKSIEVSKQIIAFAPACGLGSFVNEYEQYMPEACLASIADSAKALNMILEKQDDINFVLSALPLVYDNLVMLRNNCPTVEVFIQPFYNASTEELTNLETAGLLGEEEST